MSIPDEPVQPPRKFGLKAKGFGGVNKPVESAGAGSEGARQAPVSVHEILKGNLAKGPGMIEKTLEFRPRRSQRKRDYWKALVAGNAVLLGCVAVLGRNPVTLVFVGAGVVIYSIGLTWVMWFIMDDY